jgi:hypothetical protein
MFDGLDVVGYLAPVHHGNPCNRDNPGQTKRKRRLEAVLMRGLGVQLSI